MLGRHDVTSSASEVPNSSTWLRSEQAVAKSKRRKARRNVTVGVAHIKATFNNTTVTITDTKGDTLCWASSGTSGFKGAARARLLPARWPPSRRPKRPSSSA